jgi:regulatory protein
MARARSKSESGLDRAKRLAASRLNRRACSAEELVEWLAAKACTPGDARAAADEMARLGFLDDRALADAIARQAERKGPKARATVEAKIAKRRISPGARDGVLEDRFANRTAMQDAVQFAESKLSALPKKLDPAARARRLFGALARRGFDDETCEEAVTRVLGGEFGE